MGDIEMEKSTREAVDAFNRSDWDRTRELLADEVVYEEIGTGSRLEGAEAMLDGLQAWKSAVPDATGEIIRILSDNDTVVAEIIWRGTQSGPLTSPGGTLPATGRTFEMSAVMLQQWCDGRLAHVRHHLDILAMLVQLGALPTPAG